MMNLNEGQYMPNALEKKVAKLEAENEALRKGIGFFSSVIKSGEKWTQYCQDMYDALLK